MFRLLVLKTGALGDVLRTTSILPGWRDREPELHVTWVTAPGARDLVAHHRLVDRTVLLDAGEASDLERVAGELEQTSFDRVLSLDDEEPLCRLATRLADPARTPGRLSGAYLDAAGERRYTPDVAEWFDMGLLSVHGKAEADRLKLVNERSHAAIYAEMFGIQMGEPELPVPADELERGRARYAAAGLDGRRLVGLNTGSGGRWESKKLSVARTVELARALDEGLPGQLAFALLGGRDERERNAELASGLEGSVRFVDTGCDNSLLAFAALVDPLDLLITSDSLALHVAVARRRPVLCFFAPTSAAEIELYGRGRKVRSLADDYCSYARDADTSTLTVERLAPPALELLDAGA